MRRASLSGIIRCKHRFPADEGHRSFNVCPYPRRAACDKPAATVAPLAPLPAPAADRHCRDRGFQRRLMAQPSEGLLSGRTRILFVRAVAPTGLPSRCVSCCFRSRHAITMMLGATRRTIFVELEAHYAREHVGGEGEVQDHDSCVPATRACRAIQTTNARLQRVPMLMTFSPDRAASRRTECRSSPKSRARRSDPRGFRDQRISTFSTSPTRERPRSNEVA
ncbi:hypothetical protein AWB74_08395 [Caballeronia arvi]|uniref:Uncharacterized protein n=1 Tax=Caballeronia arvi TaxID=1777135 RepID=A0A158L5D8_9BURK|nr:hypothetical protein AWB74_08395 [Caballeronia arvi]